MGDYLNPAYPASVDERAVDEWQMPSIFEFDQAHTTNPMVYLREGWYGIGSLSQVAFAGGQSITDQTSNLLVSNLEVTTVTGVTGVFSNTDVSSISVSTVTATTVVASNADVGYVDVSSLALSSVAVSLTANEINSTLFLGDVKWSFNSSIGTSDGFLPFGYGAVSQTGDYADLYAVIGDVFEVAWTSLGYSASGAGNFYPTPPPGVFPRAAIPRSEISTSEVDTANDRIDDPDGLTFAFHILKDGTPVILTTDDTAPGGITAGTVYYARLVNSNQSIEFYDTAAHAIDTSGTTGRVDITSTGTGPHYISNAGVRLDDAGQGHKHGAWSLGNAATSGSGERLAPSDIGDFISDGVGSPIADSTNGTPRTTNETRPDTILMYGYIKAKVA